MPSGRDGLRRVARRGSQGAMVATTAVNNRSAKVIGLVGAGHFFSHFYWLVLPPLFPLLHVEFGVSYAALGFLISAMSIASGVVQLPIGFAVDRVGPVVILAGGLALLAGAFVLIGLAPSYWMVLGLMVFAGMGNAVFHPADYSILAKTVPYERLGRAFGFHTFSGHVGWAVAPALMGGFAATIGWRAGVVAVGAVGLVVALVILMNRRLLERGNESLDAPRPAARAERGIAGGIRLLLTMPILTCFLFFVLLSMALGGLGTFLVAALVQHHGVTLGAANTALTALYVGSAAGILVGGVIADRTQRHALVATLGFAAAAALIVVIGEAALPVAGLIALISVAGFASGTVAPSRDLIVRAATPAGQTGKVFGFVSVGLDVGGIITPPVFGWIIDTGEARWMFWLVAAILLLAVLAAQGAWRSRA